jgi:hypothetical protein
VQEWGLSRLTTPLARLGSDLQNMKRQPDEDQDSSVDVHAQNTAGQDRAQEMLPRPSGEE